MSNTSSATQPSADLTDNIAQDIALIREQFPLIGDKISSLWGSKDLYPYLDSIMFDERGSRHGFPDNVASALLHIYKNSSILIPNSNGDIWDQILKNVGD